MSDLRIGDYNYIFDTTVGLTASSANTNFPVTNLRNFHRSKVWRTTTATNVTLTIDLKTIEEIDTFIMVWDPESNPAFSVDECPVRLQANATNTWASPAVNTFLDGELSENFGVIANFYSSSQSYRYWRLLVNNSASQIGYLEFAKIFLGKATQLTQPPSIGFKVVEKEQSNKTYTQYGQLYADTYPSRRKISLDYKAVTEADKNLIRDIYRRTGEVKPVFIGLDTTETIFDEKEENIFYGYIDDKYEQEQVFIDFFNLSLSVEEAL